MKKILVSLLLFPCISYSQDIPEEAQRTAFKAASFGGKFSYELLSELLEEDRDFITPDVNHYSIKASDLFDPSSTPYNFKAKIDHAFRYTAIVSEQNAQLEIDSALNAMDVDPKWTKRIEQNNISKPVMQALHYNWKFSTHQNELQLISSSRYADRTGFQIFKFDNNGQMIFQGYGYIPRVGTDTVLWIRTHFDYSSGKLQRKTETTYFDRGDRDHFNTKGMKPREIIETTYENGQISKITHAFFLKKNNLKYKEEITDYYRDEQHKIDSIIFQFYTYQSEQPDNAHLQKKTSSTYANGKPQVSHSDHFPSYYRDREHKSTTTYQYDANNRMTKRETKTWDKEKQLIEATIETMEYTPNKLSYTFVEEIGKDSFPLQYEIVYRFFKQ